jgi:hypothetical protein
MTNQTARCFRPTYHSSFVEETTFLRMRQEAVPASAGDHLRHRLLLPRLSIVCTAN